MLRHEVDEARRYGIPIIVFVDTDKQLAREVIDKYMELGYSWLFDEQARALLSLFSLFTFVLVLFRSSATRLRHVSKAMI